MSGEADLIKTVSCTYISHSSLIVGINVTLFLAHRPARCPPKTYTKPHPCIVSRGHTPFRKRGKGSGNFFYSSLLRRSVQCGTNHSAVFCHMSAVITTSSVVQCEEMKFLCYEQLQSYQTPSLSCGMGCGHARLALLLLKVGGME